MCEKRVNRDETLLVLNLIRLLSAPTPSWEWFEFFLLFFLLKASQLLLCLTAEFKEVYVTDFFKNLCVVVFY